MSLSERAQAIAIRFLRWSEKYTKTDMVYLAHGGFWLGTGTIANTVLTIGLSIAAANFINPEVYGTYKYILTLFAIFTVATLPGIDPSFSQAVARGHEGSFFSVLRTQIRWGLFGTAGAILFAGYYFLNGNMTIAIPLCIIALLVPFMDSFTLYDDLLQGRRAFSQSAKLAMIGQLSSVILLIIVILVSPTVISLVI